MKKILFIIVALLLIFNLSAQDRVNVKRKIEKISESEFLSNVTWWEYDDIIGRWNQTHISVNKLSRSDKYRSYVVDNLEFGNCRIVEFEVDGRMINVLEMNYRDGAYEYPSIKCGYYTYNYFRCYEIVDLEKIRDFIDNPKYNGKKLNIELRQLNGYGRRDTKTTEFSLIDKYRSKCEWVIYKTTDGLSIRFHEIFYENDYKYDSARYKDFNKYYFESSTNDWRKLVNLVTFN